MEAKYKAQQITAEYVKLLHKLPTHKQAIFCAKLCAIVCVNEILAQEKESGIFKTWESGNIKLAKYWNEVKLEIEKI